MGVVAERTADLLATYDDAYYGGGATTGAGYDEYRCVAAHALPWAADLVRLLQPAGRVLDVGAADGTLLGMLGNVAYERFAIEVNERLLAGLERQGVRPLARDLFDPALDAHRGSFDVVTAIAVLEHLGDIRGAVERIRGLLTPEGFLLYEVPLLTGSEDDAIWYRSSLEHVFYPTADGLRFLFESVFGLPLLGKEVRIRAFGATFVGVATPSPTRHAELAKRLAALLEGPVEALAAPLERAFRFDFEVLHAADPSRETLALLPALEPRRVGPHLLSRLASLWQVDRDRASAEQTLAAEALSAAGEREAALARHLSAAAGERRRLEDTLSEHAAYVERVREDLAAAGRQTEQLQAELAAHGERASALHAELEERGARIAELQERASALDAELDEARRRIAELRADLERSRAESAALGSQLAEARAHAVARSAEGDRLKEQLAAIHGSRLWRVAVRYWRARGAARELLAGFGRAASAVLRGSGSGLARALRVVPRGAGWRPVRAVFREIPLTREVKDRWMRRLLGVGYAGPPDPGSPVVRVRQHPWPASEPLVSVVIPSFNYGDFLEAAVDSVLAQTWRDLEVLVVEGGSTDDRSREVARTLHRPKTTVLWREARAPVGDNRNYGISRARGKYICCLDADDELRPTFLEKALFLAEAHGFDLVSTSIESHGNEHRIYHVRTRPTLADMLAANHVTTCALFRRDLWELAGGYRDAGFGTDYVYEDWRLFQRMSALGARIFNIVEEPLFRYRVHGASQSALHRSPEAMEAQRLAVRRCNEDVIAGEALERSARRASERVEVEDGLLDLVPRARGDGRPTILLAMPFLLVGGAERLLSEVVRHLTRIGYRVVVVTTLYTDPAFGDATPWFAESTSEIYHLPRFLAPEHWPSFVDYLFQTRRPAVLWIAGSTWFYERLPELKGRYAQLRVIDLLFNTVGHTADNRRFRDHIDLTLVENEEVERWLLAAGESPSRLTRIESGVDLHIHRPMAKDPTRLAELGIPADACVVGFSGRWSEEKAPEMLLDVAERLRDERDVHFVMTGAGPLGDTVRSRARAAANPRLHVLGQVDDVRAVLSLYDVLMLPSRLDGRPVVVLESLAMGIPVIASRVGDLPRLVQDGRTGFLCPPGDGAALAERVRELAARPDLRARMSREARRFAEAQLDANGMLERYAAALHRLGVRAKATAGTNASAIASPSQG